MQSIRISSLRAGNRFEQALFLPSGQKLLNPGVELSQRHIELLARQSVAELKLADSLDEFATSGLMNRVDHRQLRIGQTAAHDIYGPGGSLVLERGQEIEPHHLAALGQAEGAFAAHPDQPTDPAERRRERMMMADMVVQDLEQYLPDLPFRVPGEELEIWDRLHNPSSDPRSTDHWLAQRRDAVDLLSGLYGRIQAGLLVDKAQFACVVEDLFNALISHRANFTQLALMCPRRDDYLADHAFTVAVLAMATGAQLTWSADHIKRIGLIGLTFDLGMLLIPQRIRVGGCQLTDIDRNLVQRHTAFSLVMSQSIKGIEPIEQLVAYQHHERENGSGYPRALRGDRIADMSRVIAVADVFAAMTSPRSYRQVRLPYSAMEQLIRSAAGGQFFKPAARALVQAAGLFPVGSYVKLSNQKLARIIGANANHMDRPVVQVIDHQAQPIGSPIDLSRLPVESLAVERPIAGPQVSRQAG